MEIQLGDIVLYQLTKDDAEIINRRYRHASHNQDLMRVSKTGYQAHFGNAVGEGTVVVLIVTQVWSSTCINGQAILDSNDSLWVTSACKGEDPGYWSYRK